MNSKNSKKPSGGSTPWPIPADSEAFQSAYTQSHSAVQWLARLANSYQVPASDGSHLHMTWNSTGGAINTNDIAPETSVEMRLPEFELQFRENDTLTKHVLVLDEKSPAEAEAWTLIELLHRGFDRDKYSKSLPYDVSGLLSGDARHYQTSDLETGFAELAQWLQTAAAILADIEPGDAPRTRQVRFAPESFSLFIRLHPDNGRPAVGNYVEAGFCIGNQLTADPYFYVSSKPEKIALQKLPVADIRKNALDANAVKAFFDVEAKLQDLQG